MAELVSIAKAPETMRPGEALLAATHNGAGELWWLKPRCYGPSDRPFAPGTLESWNALHATVVRSLPILGTMPRSFDAPRLGADVVVALGPWPEWLQGRSFDLAVGLAMASRLLGLPLPRDFVALASVDEDGGTLQVGGLEQKLACISTWALGVRRMLVAPGQLGQAREYFGDGALAVTTLEEALEYVLPDLAKRLEERWNGDRDGAMELLEKFYAQALHGKRSMPSWRGFSAACAVLEHVFRGDLLASGRLLAARHIANRHQNINAEMPTLHALATRSQRLAVLSHALQALGDASPVSVTDEMLRREVRNALSRLHPSGKRAPEDLKVLGAAGRAIALIAPDEAASLLREATLGWLERDDADECSYALSEWLRLTGILGKGEELDEVMRAVLPALEDHPQTESSALAFVYLAAARALVCLGRPDEASTMLGEARVPWHQAPEHVAFQRWRWRARALDLMECHAEADSERAALARRVGRLKSAAGREPPVLRANHALAQMDRALRLGQSVAEWLSLLDSLEEESRWIHKLRRHRPLDVDEARWIADAFPY